MLQSEINRRMPDIVTLAIFGIWQSLQALGRAKGDEEEEHHLIASQVPNIYVEDRGWQLRKVPKLMKKLWKVMSLHHQRRWKGGKINVKSYSLKRIKCLFFYAFSSSSTFFFSPIWNKRYIPVWGCHKNSKVYWRYKGEQQSWYSTGDMSVVRRQKIPFGMAATSSFGSLCGALNLRIAKSRPWPWQWSGWVCNGFILKLVYLKLLCQKWQYYWQQTSNCKTLQNCSDSLTQLLAKWTNRYWMRV